MPGDGTIYLFNGCLTRGRDLTRPLTQERMLRHQVPNDVVPTSSLVGFAGALATGITMWVIILLIALG